MAARVVKCPAEMPLRITCADDEAGTRCFLDGELTHCCQRFTRMWRRMGQLSPDQEKRSRTRHNGAFGVAVFRRPTRMETTLVPSVETSNGNVSPSGAAVW